MRAAVDGVYRLAGAGIAGISTEHAELRALNFVEGLLEFLFGERRTHHPRVLPHSSASAVGREAIRRQQKWHVVVLRAVRDGEQDLDDWKKTGLAVGGKIRAGLEADP